MVLERGMPVTMDSTSEAFLSGVTQTRRNNLKPKVYNGKPGVSPELCKEFKRLRKLGLTYTAIGLLYGFNETTVAKQINGTTAEK